MKKKRRKKGGDTLILRLKALGKNILRTKRPVLWEGDVEEFLRALPSDIEFDLVVTSPPYNLGKEYEQRQALEDYRESQRAIIKLIASRLKPGGSLCWQVGNFIENGEIVPLDIELHEIFRSENLKLRNRIIWHFGHGLHNRKRFSGRYEVIMWYTKGDDYIFNLDAVRIPSKYPAKKHYKGLKKGAYSSHPLGKNPEDVWDMHTDFWDIPNVKGNHVEKTRHPCQFPVGLAERLVLALTHKGQLVFDPFAGVGSTGVAAVLRGRRFMGCEKVGSYISISKTRIEAALCGKLRVRPHDKPVYDHRKSNLSIPPKRRQLPRIRRVGRSA